MAAEPSYAAGCLATALLCASACGGGSSGGPAPSQPVAPQITDVERYLPLVADTVLAYDTENDLGERGVLMMHVQRKRPDLAELYVAGRAQRLEITAAGIRQANGGWVLKSPLVQGQHFKGDFGDVLVSSVGKRIETPAGTFTDCVETVERTAQKEVTTTFCSGVGIAELIVQGQVGTEYVRERAVLKSHGPKVDLGTDLPPPPPKHPD
ncbi:MAG: hypothetical protein KF718_20075 [Polyangiaceae bacterium]|nr:hypothetical protein [Polyangiaceae bacterium]